MRILFDQGTPVPLRAFLTQHEIATTFELGWGQLQNGELLRQAEDAGFDALITTDQNLRYQQQLTGRKLSIVVLMTTSWPRIERHAAHVVERINTLQVGGYVDISIP